MHISTSCVSVTWSRNCPLPHQWCYISSRNENDFWIMSVLYYSFLQLLKYFSITHRITHENLTRMDFLYERTLENALTSPDCSVSFCMYHFNQTKLSLFSEHTEQKSSSAFSTFFQKSVRHYREVDSKGRSLNCEGSSFISVLTEL